MGTTLNALGSQQGVRIGYALAIEGCEYLLTDAADTAPVLTAWSGSDWTSALSGLIIDGEWKQSINPFATELNGSSLRWKIIPDAADTFGTLVHAPAAGNETVITEDVDHSETTIDVADESQLSAATAYAYVGAETIKYTSKPSGQISGCTRGFWSPFTTNGGARFSRQHLLGNVAYAAQLPIQITTTPRQWVGRWVALYVHRIAGDTWDTRAQAQLVFAGRIVDVRDEPDGTTSMEAEDILSVLNSAIVLHNQFRAVVPEGFHVRAGWVFTARDSYASTSSPYTRSHGESSLTVVASAPGTDEMAEGWYTAEELASVLNDWFKTTSGLLLEWSAEVRYGPEGYRFAFTAALPSGSYRSLAATISGATESFWRFLGFDPSQADDSKYGPGVGAFSVTTVATFSGVREPARIMAALAGDQGSIELDATFGTWYDNRDRLPTHLKRGYTVAGEDWGILQIGNTWVLAKHDSDTLFTGVVRLDHLGRTLREDPQDDEVIGISQSGDIEVRQVVVMETTLSDFLIKLFASTGTAGFNHATYDSEPYGFGVGVPWSLLGDAFVESVQHLEAATVVNGARIVITEPTRLMELIGADLLARGTVLAWKNGGIRIIGWTTPNALTAVHTLTEDNKASATQGDDQRTSKTITDSYMRNIVKFEYQRTLRGEYTKTREFRFQRSIDDHGERALTIKLRNSLPDTAEQLMTSYVARVMPVFGQPLYTLTRTISFNLYEDVAPGDIALLTDSFVRDPATGQRSITGKPCVIGSHSFSWGGNGSDMYGEVELIFNPYDRSAALAPSADVDETHTTGGFTNGYDATAKQLYLKSHSYSLASESEDYTHFDVDDEIRIFEIDPAAGSAGNYWDRRITARSGATITIDSALSSPSFSTSKYYRIQSQVYSSAQTSQRDSAYAADDSDRQIEDLRVPFEYGENWLSGSYTAGDPAIDPEIIPLHLVTAEGNPVSASLVRSVHDSLNALSRYSGPGAQGGMSGSVYNGNGLGAGETWLTIFRKRLYVGPGKFPPGYTRKVYVQPTYGTTSPPTSGSVRVTVGIGSPTYPPGQADTIDPVYAGSARSYTWSAVLAGLFLGTEQSFDIPNVGTPWLFVTVDVTKYGKTSGLPSLYVGPLESDS